ncbi:MAG: hypothetical protein JO002_09260 [Burkholderiaceae bacterium]|nr:hypothetical protein [Burkholderiaceae bacterium]
MSKLSSKSGMYLGLMLAGVGLMSVAMFLHPMSPEDFLGLVLSDPLQTVTEIHGREAAALFWGGALVGIGGAASLAVHLFALLRAAALHISLSHAPAH